MTGKEIKEQINDAVACDDMFFRHELRDAICDMADENAKLREFASGMYGLLEMFDQLMGTDDNLGTPRPLLFGDGRSFRDVARELGIEVRDE